ncbi:HAD family hydrolase [Nioella nitratireducens]|uniref:HAD family hydrolase n=1 Tax=Nioella nitratireducens TaxID=1287720 RepID=UPI0008FD0B73|nr:HAD family phosphatase [Nioella nitratireducens]
MTIEAVVFDIGRVLINWDPVAFYDREIGEDRRRELFASVDLDAMNARLDMGDGFQEVIYPFADENPRFRDEIRLWHDRWIEMARPAIPHSVHLLRALRAKGIPIFALSNFGVETYEIAQGEYDFLTEFDREFISGQRRLAKPDPAFYAVLETESGLSPQALFFTDDRPENIATALDRGWHGHLFEGPQGLADQLVAHGLLTQEESTP